MINWKMSVWESVMNKKIVRIAAETMKVFDEVAEDSYKEILDQDAYYF